ncbi:MAG: tetratricopeptide repeat protein [Holophagales bacterium]|nr:tetratricopeptide repeat protein [Holophagales bacterium]MYG29430.1 tetratricopeptide repeat protein [Holophagales bacterium]MYI80052.1 tetratricopeptide repeat protein [Holophagales bacterium]
MSRSTVGPLAVGLTATWLLAAANGVSARPAQQHDEPSAAMLLRQASLHESRGDYEAAIAGYDRAIEVEPQNWQLYLLRGSARFKAGRIEASIEDFDQVVALDASQDPYLWQRGISYYYAGRFEDCRGQFERHRLVNPNDVENAVWHLLCVAVEDGLEAAQEAMLPVGPDARRPMKEIDALFRGDGSVEEVEAAVAAESPGARFYADLYLGLYYELIGEMERAAAAIERAASLPNRGYMVEVARIHRDLTP